VRQITTLLAWTEKRSIAPKSDIPCDRTADIPLSYPPLLFRKPIDAYRDRPKIRILIASIISSTLTPAEGARVLSLPAKLEELESSPRGRFAALITLSPESGRRFRGKAEIRYHRGESKIQPGGDRRASRGISSRVSPPLPSRPPGERRVLRRTSYSRDTQRPARSFIIRIGPRRARSFSRHFPRQEDPPFPADGHPAASVDARVLGGYRIK